MYAGTKCILPLVELQLSDHICRDRYLLLSWVCLDVLRTFLILTCKLM